MTWSERVVVVAGGSAGLGLAIAKAFCERGARVVMLGRDEQRLADAKAMLGDSAATCVVNMTDDDAVQRASGSIVAELGRIDVWINNVGASSRGTALETAPKQFQESLDVNFFTAVHGARAAAPHLKASGGSLVFIGSLASKTASKHLAAYPAAKFALAGYAHQLRLELAADGVHVLLVCPGPIARDDAGARYDAQSEDLPADARKPGGGARIKSLDPNAIARRIVAACESRRHELVLPGKAKWLFAISQLSPQLGDWILKRFSS